MGSKLREFFLGRVVLEGPWTFFFRFVEIFFVVSVVVGLWQQFS
jgi:hypothetical protein